MSELEKLQFKMQAELNIIRQAIDFGHEKLVQDYLDEMENNIKKITEVK